MKDMNGCKSHKENCNLYVIGFHMFIFSSFDVLSRSTSFFPQKPTLALIKSKYDRH